jgi:polyphenol oxidase
LVQVNKQQLVSAGVKDENIFDPEICTACKSNEFFSYRREGKSSGRMMSVIMLK